MSTKLIQLEFNELCPRLMAKFIDQGHLPNFAKLRDQSLVYTTDAEEVPPYLEPWIQWVTVHTGLSYAKHQVFDLGDGHKLDLPRIWDIIGEAGHKVWVCGSMNASFRRPITGFILPDPWSTGVTPYPEGEFDDYYHFVRTNVQEHTREETPLTKAEQLRFLAYMVRHGMTPETVRTIISQLLAERSGENRWKRAVILDRLQWDIFAYYWKRHQPKFSTFFLNSTAHFQHVYWRNMEPELFDSKPSDREQAAYQDAILFGYKSMDTLVGKCLELAGNDTSIVFATALSQQPCLKYEESGGKVFYRPNNPNQLFAFAGISGNAEFAPVMSEQFHIYLSSPEAANDATSKMLALKMEGQPVMLARSEGSAVFSGCTIFTKVPKDAVVTNARGEGQRFYELFYDCQTVKSGMHHPDGILWISTPERTHILHHERVPLRAVAPTVLSLVDHRIPEFMELPPLVQPVHAIA